MKNEKSDERREASSRSRHTSFVIFHTSLPSPRLGVSAVRRSRRSGNVRGFTLLEVLLSLTLATLVMLLIGVAIDAHVTISQRGRAKIEQAQLARSVFRMIGDDIRNAIVYAPLDFSSIANLNLDADLGGALPDSGDMGGDGTGGDGTGGMGDGGMSPGGMGGGQGGSIPGGNSQGGNTSSGGQNSGGNQTSGGQQSTGGSGNSTTGGAGSTSGTSSALDDVAATAVDTPGVYGSAYHLEVDISRLPRVDEYDMMIQNGAGAIADVPSDVKTVAYYVADGSSNALPGGPLSADAAGGLVRRSVDRAVTSYAYNAGSMAALDDSAAVLAPEVTDVEFGYFDGSTWGDTWDMVEKGAPPIAIRVTVTIATPKVESIFDRTLNAVSGSSDSEDETTTYTQVVYLPAAEAASASAASESSSTDAAATGDASAAEAAP